MKISEKEVEEQSSDDDELVPIKEKSKKIDEQYRTISTYNGGKTDKYSWSQDITCLDIEIPLKV